METLHRLFMLDSILRSYRRPVSKNILLEKLECSESTFKRLIDLLRNHDIPINYSKQNNGYYYDYSKKVEIPGLWFSYDELQALLIIHQMLGKLQPGLLNEYFQPLIEQVNALLAAAGKTPEYTAQCFQIIPIAHQNIPENIFTALSQAVLKKLTLSLHYRDINGNFSQRIVSPQRLIYYRDHWYLDAWCHLRVGLRTFWVAGIESAKIIDKPAKEIEQKILDQYVTSSYGIFTGSPNNIAHLRFTGQAIMRIKGAVWHPMQRQKMNADGSLELWLPYSDHRELVMDILRYGAEVKVLAPETLRIEVISRFKKAIYLYENLEEVQPVS